MSLEQQLKDRLAQLSPTYLEVVNESSGHGGYFPGKESHFKAVIVSEAFTGLRAVPVSYTHLTLPTTPYV